MSSTSRTSAAGWMVAATLVAGITLSGCSDIYYDRRDTISLGAGDAIASNRDTHMVDPWPVYSANRNIAFNGERMQRAVECYRANKVTPPADLNTSPSLTGGTQAMPEPKCAGNMSSGGVQPVSRTNGQPGSTTNVINP